MVNTDEAPLFSIAMATYNGEKYIEEQLDSILHQTITDYELIICDDCSTDRTWEILQRYANEDKRIVIVRNPVNLGLKNNFGKALSMCRGQYIALSDQDDIWSENHIEVLYHAIGDKVLSCGNSLLVDERDVPMNMTLKEQVRLDYVPCDDFDKLKSILLYRNPYFGSCMLFRREILQYVLPIPENVTYHDAWIASVACLVGGINYVDEPLLHYRRVPTSVTGMRTERWSRKAYCLHGWFFSDRIGYVESLLQRIDSIPASQRNKLLFYENLVKRNTKWRKPFTIACLLTEYRSIYSCKRF